MQSEADMQTRARERGHSKARAGSDDRSTELSCMATTELEFMLGNKTDFCTWTSSFAGI